MICANKTFVHIKLKVCGSVKDGNSKPDKVAARQIERLAAGRLGRDGNWGRRLEAEGQMQSGRGSEMYVKAGRIRE
jgi:hypothetical protein